MISMKYLLICRNFISLMVLFSFFDNFGMENFDILFKVIFVGDAYVGKTQIINKFVNKSFEKDYEAIVGFKFAGKIIKFPNMKIELRFWDCCGDEANKSLISSFYNTSSIIVFVYAINNKKSFENIQSWDKDVTTYTNKKPKFLLVGNKLDLEEGRQVSTEEAQEYAKKNKMEFVEVSAKTGDGISDDMFNSIIKELLDDMKKEKKEKIQIQNYGEYIDINHNKNLSFCDKYCSCCPCLKKTEGNVEEEKGGEDDA